VGDGITGADDDELKCYYVPVRHQRRPQCSRSGNRSVTKKDWNFSHRSVGSGRCRGSLDPVATAGAAWGGMEPAGVLLSYGRVVLAQPGSNCTSNSIIHVQRSQLGTCYNSTTAAVGYRLPLQLDHTDRWLKFQFFLHAPVEAERSAVKVETGT